MNIMLGKEKCSTSFSTCLALDVMFSDSWDGFFLVISPLCARCSFHQVVQTKHERPFHPNTELWGVFFQAIVSVMTMEVSFDLTEHSSLFIVNTTCFLCALLKSRRSARG